MGLVSRLLGIALVGSLLMSANGCSSAPKKPKPMAISFDVQENVNPDIHGRPSPVVMRMFELKSNAAFDGIDFFSLYERDKESLGAEMLAREEYPLRPGDKLKFDRLLQPDTRFIAVMAAFRDLEHAQWRAVVPVQPGKTATISGVIDGLKITLKAQ